MRKVEIEQYAERLSGNLYVVRPVGQKGFCGVHPTTWTAQYVKASGRTAAVLKANRLFKLVE